MGSTAKTGRTECGVGSGRRCGSPTEPSHRRRAFHLILYVQTDRVMCFRSRIFQPNSSFLRRIATITAHCYRITTQIGLTCG